METPTAVYWSRIRRVLDREELFEATPIEDLVADGFEFSRRGFPLEAYEHLLERVVGKEVKGGFAPYVDEAYFSVIRSYIEAIARAATLHFNVVSDALHDADTAGVALASLQLFHQLEISSHKQE